MAKKCEMTSTGVEVKQTREDFLTRRKDSAVCATVEAYQIMISTKNWNKK